MYFSRYNKNKCKKDDIKPLQRNINTVSVFQNTLLMSVDNMSAIISTIYTEFCARHSCVKKCVHYGFPTVLANIAVCTTTLHVGVNDCGLEVVTRALFNNADRLAAETVQR